ncbi:hypothetical protein [Ammoniphilus sp. YIM 78166]|uniref:hypothetical protein n=1 Tax=Ammoniphilus sp. YIM 78166 TaxID=1644106 RepID=UPI0014319400|nr:hypothetical protein [Ammoniphilus sp. YIM 78166]
MFSVIGVLMVSGILFAWEIKPLLKKSRRKELWLFSFMMAIATGLMIAEVMGMNILNPNEGLKVIFSPIGKLA